MRVLEIPFCFAPDPVGGTEIYVGNLARDLQSVGVEVLIVAPGKSSQTYEIDGLRVRRFATAENVIDVAELYGEGDPLAAAEFAKIVDEEKPDLVHVHAFTRAVSLLLIKACKLRGIPVIFTFHTPTVTCQRGTLMLWGEIACDGKLHRARCGGCTLQGLGLQRDFAKVLGYLPPHFGRWIGRRGLQGGVWTALRTSALIELRHAAFREMALEVDHFVAVCDWVRDVIVENGVSSTKVSISRHGIDWKPQQTCAPSLSWIHDLPSAEVRFAFVGRFDPTKGLHVVIEAIGLVPQLKIALDVYGIAQDAAGVAYKDRMERLAGSDPRISFRGAIAPMEVVERLRQYDFLLVPSQWLETGPLVVLEAFAAGIPVIGWGLGGTAELVQDGVNGLLIEPNLTNRWAETICRVAGDAELRAQLKRGVRPPRRSSDVAYEMLKLYRTFVSSGAQAPEISTTAN
jgi:glycosyltransferase involved in cell wall biosynthesis